MKSINDSLTQTLLIEGETISRLVKELDLITLENFVKIIATTTGKVVVSGCGTSGVAAKKFVHSLSCIEIPAVYLNPTDAVHGALGILQKNDTFVLISKGGNTQELVALLNSAKTKGARLISVGENKEGKISQAADLFIQVKVKEEPDPFKLLATASTLAVISMFDAVCVALMRQTNYTKEQFAINHPGGAVGDKLINKQ